MLCEGDTKNFLIVGYGTSGKSAFNFLKSLGHNVYVYDDNIPNTRNVVDNINWGVVDYVIKSPGIGFMEHNIHPIIKIAVEHDVPVISCYDLFMMYNPEARVISITGTNGKSTTTALVHHILKKSGINSSMGGNIGIPYFDLPRSDVYVFEMSSYELASSRNLNFDVAAIINIRPDHLDKHGSFENYVIAKHRSLDCSNVKVISYEDTITYEKYAGAENTIVISRDGNTKADIYICEGVLMDRGNVILDLSNFSEIRGKHNHENVAFAYAICRNFNIPPKEIAKNIASFKSLPHRLNVVRKINNVLFVNDSKATNPDSASKALDTYVGYNIFWLVGGRSKKTDPHKDIDPYLASVRNIYLFGESMDEFYQEFSNMKNCIKCETMSNALLKAYKDARKETEGPSVILLSPMCASFDQFNNFEERGLEFCKLVNEL